MRTKLSKNTDRFAAAGWRCDAYAAVSRLPAMVMTLSPKSSAGGGMQTLMMEPGRSNPGLFDGSTKPVRSLWLV